MSDKYTPDFDPSDLTTANMMNMMMTVPERVSCIDATIRTYNALRGTDSEKVIEKSLVEQISALKVLSNALWFTRAESIAAENDFTDRMIANATQDQIEREAEEAKKVAATESNA